jgi:hypothetical protein
MEEQDAAELTDLAQESGYKMHDFTFTQNDPTSLVLENQRASNCRTSISKYHREEMTHRQLTETNVQLEVDLCITGAANIKVGQVKRTWDRNIKRSWHFHGHRQFRGLEHRKVDLGGE